MNGSCHFHVFSLLVGVTQTRHIVRQICLKPHRTVLCYEKLHCPLTLTSLCYVGNLSGGYAYYDTRHDIGVILNKQTGHKLLYTMFTTSPGATEDLIPPAEDSLKTMGRALLNYEGDSAKQPAAQPRRAINPNHIDHGRMRY